VDSFVRGGPADLHLLKGLEKIIPGDILVEIDGAMCCAEPIEKVSRLILGPSGSWVQLGFERLESTGPKVIRIRLERKPFICPTLSDLEESPGRSQFEQGMKIGILRRQRSPEQTDNKTVSFKSDPSATDSSLGSARKLSPHQVLIYLFPEPCVLGAFVAPLDSYVPATGI
jgi:hypothetical protein